MRNVIAVVCGAAVAFVLVMLIEALGHAVYPPPSDLDPADMESLRAYVATLPPGALLFPLAAWALAALGGGLVAARISTSHHRLMAWIVGGLVLAGTVLNLVMIPHPAWFAAVAVAAIVAATLLAGRLAAASNES